MTRLEKKVTDKRIDNVIASYNQELINDEVQCEFIVRHHEHTPEGDKMLCKLSMKMKSRHELFMLFGEDPYQRIDHYYEVFCPA